MRVSKIIWNCLLNKKMYTVEKIEAKKNEAKKMIIKNNINMTKIYVVEW